MIHDLLSLNTLSKSQSHNATTLLISPSSYLPLTLTREVLNIKDYMGAITLLVYTIQHLSLYLDTLSFSLYIIWYVNEAKESKDHIRDQAKILQMLKCRLKFETKQPSFLAEILTRICNRSCGTCCFTKQVDRSDYRCIIQDLSQRRVTSVIFGYWLWSVSHPRRNQGNIR